MGERAILFAIDNGSEGFSVEDSLRELTQLAWSNDFETCQVLIQRRLNPDPGTYLGEGKVAELKSLLVEHEAELAICDDELNAAQVYNLEERLNAHVIDRTQLILDIFAHRANSREGKVQVELARLSYLLPRLTGKGVQMSRMGGGAATQGTKRGPGETKLEMDRSYIRHRIAQLRRELKVIRSRRCLQRRTRRRFDTGMVALVGYTNAGKSTLLNTLTGAQVLVENRLFATLDPTIRKMQLPRGEEVCLIDTVGFVRKLPHDLVAAFRATLEEVVEADVLLHVLDAAHPHMWEQAQAVHTILAELGVMHKPMVTAFNKADLLSDEEVKALCARVPQSCAVSAINAQGCDALRQLICDALPERFVVRTYRVPYSDGQAVNWLHNTGLVLHERYHADAVEIKVELRGSMTGHLHAYEQPGG